MATPDYLNDIYSIPTDIAVCPYCGSDLFFDFDEYDLETGMPTESGLHVWCPADLADKIGGDHDDMPYAYWLPVNMRVFSWLAQSQQLRDGIRKYREQQDRMRLDEWNSGRPIRIGVKHGNA